MSETTIHNERARTATGTDGQCAAICPLCVTVTTGDDHETVRKKAETHNQNMHDGERVARTVKPKRNHIEAFLSRVRRQYGRDVMAEVGALIAETDPWGGSGEH